MSLLSDKQIQAQVSAIRRRQKNGPQRFAIRASGDWTGPDRLVIDGVEHLVLPCVSDLQLREALLRAETENKPAVLLCSMKNEAIGDDVIDRLAKQRVFSPQMTEMVAELFSISPARIDPRALKNKALMQNLLEMAPAEGYPSIPSGTLDWQTAWLALMGRVMGERIDVLSVTQFLEWSMSEDKLSRLHQMDAELKKEFVDWCARTTGESARFLMASIDSELGADLVPLGAVLSLVFDPERHRSPEHQTARVRLERFFQNREIDPESARAWSRAADTILAKMKDEDDRSQKRQLLNRLDDLIDVLGLKDKAWLSRHSPLGLEQRCQRVGKALQNVVESRGSSDLGEVRAGIALVKRHLLGEADSERLTRLEMAFRLARWLHSTGKHTGGKSLDELVAHYHQDGGFIDWARNRLKETDESPAIQKAFEAILKRVEERAESFETDFARQLRDWTRDENRSPRFTLIEDFLQEVAAPVAKQQPIMMLVLDGMSVAVFRQLLDDILRHDWTEIANEELSLPRPVLATLPSVTSISRRALFLGRLDPATNGTEEGEFKNNDLLFHGSGSQIRPQLFKMGDLTDGNQGGIAPKVSKAIADRKCRVVAVVINAIDDHLDSGKQVDFTWTRDRIRGFRDLLRQASDAERLVVLTSDHGHILDFGTKQLSSSKDGRGDRFRSADGALQDGELEFEGSRIYRATGDNRITLAYSGGIRYGKDKRGYHGGANPQEMIVPMAVLSDTRALIQNGWTAIPSHQPSWWRVDSSEPTPTPVARQKPEKAVEGLELFEHTGSKPSSRPVWIDDLFKSPIYREQSKRAVRGAPDVELMTKLLRSLDVRGGTAVKQALAQELGMPPFRLDGLIQNVSRILNVDGYPVIDFDRASDTVSLNADLLRTQFELKAKES